jgi:hypothetical protein
VRRGGIRHGLRRLQSRHHGAAPTGCYCSNRCRWRMAKTAEKRSAVSSVIEGGALAARGGRTDGGLDRPPSRRRADRGLRGAERGGFFLRLRYRGSRSPCFCAGAKNRRDRLRLIPGGPDRPGWEPDHSCNTECRIFAGPSIAGRRKCASLWRPIEPAVGVWLGDVSSHVREHSVSHDGGG